MLPKISEAPGIHMKDLIEIFDKVYDSMPKSVFMSMQFSPETEDTFQTVKDVQAILKREDGIDFRAIPHKPLKTRKKNGII